MSPANTNTLPKDFDLLSIIGGNAGADFVGTSTNIVLKPGEVTKFTAFDGTEAQIKVDEMKLIRLETIKSDRNKNGVVNLQARVFFQGEVQDAAGKAHPYCSLNGYHDMAKEIRGQFWQASQAGASKMYAILAGAGWSERANIGANKQNGGTNGILLRSTPPRPDNGDFSGYGMPIESLTVGQTWDPQRQPEGFQDFWTSADEVYNELLVISGLNDEGAVTAATDAYRRHARMVCGGRKTQNGWPKAAQFTAFKFANQDVIDLWTAGVHHDLGDLLAAEAAKATAAQANQPASGELDSY